jgi:succinoglycan biosynthesis transport protein ExoP
MSNVIHFLRILQRNLKWMMLLGVATAVAVFFFTRNMPKEYESETEIFTGITSGLSVDNVEGEKIDFFAANNAFDNIINIIQSRQTLQEVGMRLLAGHLLLTEPSLENLSAASFEQLQEWIDAETRKKLIVENDTEATYLNIVNWYQTDFHSDAVKAVFNNGGSPYSHKTIRSVRVFRVQNSDLIRLAYTSNDPAISQQTLEILNEVFIRMVAEVKVAQTNDIVAYFRNQVNMAEDRLSDAEEKLKVFKTENRVINYGEQTKSIAMMKEYMEDEYQKELATRASAQAAVSKLETQLSVNKEMLKYSESMLEKRQELADINKKIAVLEVYHNDEEMLSEMRSRAEKIKAQLSNDLYNRMEYSRTTEGVSVNKVLEEWLEYTLALDRSNARIKVYENRKVYFNDLYDEFSVVGSTIGKIERQIDVEEKNYLELLHSLNLALMRLSSETLASDGLQVTVAPFFPLSPLPSKRLMLVIVAFIVTFILPYAWAIVRDLLDLSIKNGKRLASLSGTKHIGSIAQTKMLEKWGGENAPVLRTKVLRLVWSKIENELRTVKDKPVFVNLLSMRKTEGKSFVATELATELQNQGYSVFVLQPGEGGYAVSENLNRVSDWSGLTEEDLSGYDVVLVEHPALLDEPYAKKLLAVANINVMVAWSGRIWNDADKRKMQEVLIEENAPCVSLLNGADQDEMEKLVGELPKKISGIRKLLKRYMQLQFSSGVASA